MMKLDGLSFEHILRYRGSKSLRSVSLTPPYQLRTIVSLADIPLHDGSLPSGKVDPLRIILCPTEDAAFVAERRQGYIFKVVGLRSESPRAYTYSDNSSTDFKVSHALRNTICR